MKRSKMWLNILWFFVFALSVQAGLHPLHTLIAVNDNSASSRAVGHYYAQQRGIPERNICPLSVPTNHEISVAVFSNQVQKPLLDFIVAQGLSNQISTIVLSREIPYRVYDSNEPSFYANGLPAALFYGYKNAINHPMPAPTSNRYFAMEQPFSSDLFGTTNRHYLTFMLTSRQPDQSLRLIDRSAGCDAATPTGTIYLLHSSDAARSVQWPQYNHAQFLNRLLPGGPLQCVQLDMNQMTNQTDVMGHCVGLSAVNDVPLNTYLPGSIAIHLTSFGGCLFDPGTQMSLLEWLRYGASGSYGTCTEPYNKTEKFPDMRMYFWYRRGFSLGESLVMSVQNPYEGVFAGDPLCSPYAQPAVMACSGITHGELLSGVATGTVQILAHDERRPVNRVDLYLDGLFYQTIAQVGPEPGNEISVTLGSSTRSVTVTTGDTAFTLAEKLEAQINQPPPLGLTACAAGDRVMITRTLNEEPANTACSASASTGTASVLSVTAYVTQTNLLDSQAAAYEQIYLWGTPTNGDVVRIIITNTAGVSVTNEITATNGATAKSLLTQLAGLINADTNLQTTAGCSAKYIGAPYNSFTECYLTARTNTYEGAKLHVDFQVTPVAGSALTNSSFSDYFNDNADDLRAGAMLFVAAGSTNLTTPFTLDTGTLPDGPHTLTILAREGTGVGTWSSTAVSFRVSNTPLECAISAPVDRANIEWQQTISFQITANSPATVTGAVLYVEGKQKALTNGVPWNPLISASDYGPGIITVQAEAMDSAGNRALSDPIQLVLYQDTDADGLPDWWEYQYFSGSTNAIATADTDGDSAHNLAEYTAFTLPTNAASVLAATISPDPSSTNIVLQWPGSENRFYSVYYCDDLLTSSWVAAESGDFRGWSPVTAWTNFSVTNDARAYRIHAIIP